MSAGTVITHNLTRQNQQLKHKLQLKFLYATIKSSSPFVYCLFKTLN